MLRIVFFTVLLLSYACSDSSHKTAPEIDTNTPSPAKVAIENSLTITQEEKPTSTNEQNQPTISGKSSRTAVSTPKLPPPTALSRSGKTTVASPSTTLSTAAKDSSTTPADNKTTETDSLLDLPTGAPDHQAFDALLRQYVDSKGQVNYTAFKQAENQLGAYLNTLSLATPAEGWAKNEALAYWMNAYNAYTLKLILQNWPLSSVMDLHGGKPWDVKWIELAGKTYSLNQIEHQIIRPQFKDARIHFAVNCAAKSCPPLYNRAFTSQGLNSTLERLTKAFINNEAYNKTAGTTAQVSKLFDWYQEDFGNLRTYLNTYLNTPLEADSSIGFLDYDWALNSR